jgi:thymidylate synthase (FAD)
MDAHAQLEIRSYANLIGNEIVSRWCPIAWEAFVDYRLKAVILTRYDVEIIRELAAGRIDEAIRLAVDFGLLAEGGKRKKANRERNELEMKLHKLGFAVPWCHDSV